MLSELLSQVRAQAPIIHNITNYVTVNDCANILLAVGASPIMADEPEEAEDISALCAGLVVNIGTLNARTIPAMLRAGETMRALQRPIVLDPVGAGASRLRTETAHMLIERLRPTIIRGNMSEIKTLATGSAGSRGVDSDFSDEPGAQTLDAAARLVADFSRRTGAVVCVTGATDIVTDGETTYFVHNGHPMMRAVTGAGCQLSALTAAFAAANPAEPLRAALAAVCAMGLCGETAHARLTELDGNATYRNYIIDAIYHLTPETLERGARYEMQA